jgi:hypothetical protein
MWTMISGAPSSPSRALSAASFLLGLMMSCSAMVKDQAPSNGAWLDQMRGDVYCALLSSEFEEAYSGGLVVRNNTVPIPEYVAKSLVGRNPLAVSLAALRAEPSRSVMCVVADDIIYTVADPMTEPDWSELSVRFPKANGLLEMSDIAFDSTYQRALVYAFMACGGDCGAGGVYAIEKDGPGWRVVRAVLSIDA